MAIIAHCTCDQGGVEPHPCPFASEVDDNTEYLCECCVYCTYQCAMDV